MLSDMRLFVPASLVDGRRMVMAAPAVEPVMHVFSFRSATQALDARAAVTTRRWTLVHKDVSVPDIEPLQDPSCLDGSPGQPLVWETSPEELAMSGVCGPSGFGIGTCEFVEPNVIRVLESATVMFEEMDYDSVRLRLTAEFEG